MSQLDPTLTASYDYHLPQERIALRPVTPRSSARMLVVNRKNNTITHSYISKIADFLPPETNIIVNNTKVIKARIFGHKQSGAKIECVVIKPLDNGLFLVLLRGKVKKDDVISLAKGLALRVTALLDDGSREVEFFDGTDKIGFYELISKLDAIGHIPLPPYIKRDDDQKDESDYQSRFAAEPGSVAAPTASLHFDEELLGELKQKYCFSNLTLHVGLGTFKTVEAAQIKEHTMHSEYFNIPPQTAKLIDSDQKLLCIGTTAARTVEYYNKTKTVNGECDIFINPQNQPKRVDMLLTNFHLPKSTLIMLVSAFLGIDKTLEIYKEAVDMEYRFFSYGDAMLIL